MGDVSSLPEQPLYPATWALFHALVNVENEAGEFVQRLRRLQEELERTPPPSGFYYVAPPHAGQDQETRRLVEAKREEALRVRTFRLSTKDRRRLKQRGLDEDDLVLHSPNRHYYALFDRYHQDERTIRTAIADAKLTAVGASQELDPPNAAPLARDTTRIRLDLQNLGGGVPYPMTRGDYPPTEPEIVDLVRQLTLPISEWINLIRAFLVPRPPTRAGLPGRVSSLEGTPADPQSRRVVDTPEPVTLRVERPNTRRIVITTWHKGDEIGHAEIRGPSIVELFTLVERLSKDRVGTGLISWENIRGEWCAARGWKNPLIKETTLQDYGRLIRVALHRGGLERYWEQDTAAGARWKGIAEGLSPTLETES